MRFIMTEDSWERLGSMSYRGVIGLFYDSTWGGILAFIICAVIAVLAIIGLICVMKFLFVGRKPKESAHDKWLRTGKM